MTVSDNTFLSEGFGIFFKNLVEKRPNVPKKMATYVLKNLSRALEIGICAKIASAAASRNPKAILKTLLDVINFYLTGKSSYLEKFG